MGETVTIEDLAREAKAATIPLAATTGAARDEALQAVAQALRERADVLMAANRRDLAAAEADGLAAPLLKRLKFDATKLDEVIAGVDSLKGLPDPIGLVQSRTELDAGLILERVSCPIGVIGVIFESRPDALVQISSLCLKSGNAVLLKGGSEARHTNRALADTIRQAAEAAGMPAGWLQLLETREDVAAMLALDTLIDLIIPRGSNAFVRHIMQHSDIPVLGHADGVCHVYVDVAADLDMAVAVARDSKCQYTAVCNAAETLLVHASVAADFLPAFQAATAGDALELRGCPRTVELIGGTPADAADWSAEYLDAVLAVRVVPDLDAAIAHINRYGSGHTDVIVTADAAAAERFQARVDAGNVFWNCSTRFSDGFRYGLGAEVGISTNKIHARGPVGLDGLMIYKWRLKGQGHIVAPYADGARQFTHRRLGCG